MPDRDIQTYQESHMLETIVEQAETSPAVTANGAAQQQEQQLPVGVKQVQRSAEFSASKDARALGHKIKAGQHIIVDPQLYRQWLNKLVDRDISPEIFQTVNLGYDELCQIYEQTYQQNFEESVEPFKGGITFLDNEREKELREILISDREAVKKRAPGDWHARDLVVLRILQIYHGGQLEQVTSDDLLTHHDFIDRYEKFVLDFEARNEVPWPDPDYFRS